MSTLSRDFKLESEFTEPYEQWKKDPNPHTTGSMLKAMQPAIDRGISAYAGRKSGPIVKSQARKLALQALRTYDPSKAALRTHVINHMKGLQRAQRRSEHVLKTPERVMLDRGRLDTAATELSDRFGRDPSIQELADYTGIAPKRIEYVRRFRSPVSESALSAQVGGGGEVSGYSPAVEHESDTWIRAVYADANPVNQKIMEWSLGMFGEPVLSNNEIAKRLGITPGAVTQRKALIQLQLDRQEELSPF